MTHTNKTESVLGVAGTRETAAASLLVVGRLALAEYAARRDHDPVLLISLHDEAVAAWVDAWGCDRAKVESAISNIHANLCDGADIDSRFAPVAPVSVPDVCTRH